MFCLESTRRSGGADKLGGIFDISTGNPFLHASIIWSNPLAWTNRVVDDERELYNIIFAVVLSCQKITNIDSTGACIQYHYRSFLQ